MRENDRLATAPILVINLRAVVRFDLAHRCNSFECFARFDNSDASVKSEPLRSNAFRHAAGERDRASPTDLKRDQRNVILRTTISRPRLYFPQSLLYGIIERLRRTVLHHAQE